MNTMEGFVVNMTLNMKPGYWLGQSNKLSSPGKVSFNMVTSTNLNDYSTAFDVYFNTQLSLNGKVQSYMDGFVPNGQAQIQFVYAKIENVYHAMVLIKQGTNSWSVHGICKAKKNPLFAKVSVDNAATAAMQLLVEQCEAKSFSAANDPEYVQLLSSVLVQPIRCKQCNSNYLHAENNDKACKYHSGTLEYYYASIDSRDNSQFYSCCNRDEITEGCKLGLHAPHALD